MNLRCHYCLCPLTEKNLTKDHKIPKVKGGNFIDPENKILACFKCNNDKGSMPYEEFIARRKPRPLGVRKADGTFIKAN